MQEEQQELLTQPETFIASSGVKVTIPNNPTPQACENFVRAIMDITAKYSSRK